MFLLSDHPAPFGDQIFEHSSSWKPCRALRRGSGLYVISLRNFHFYFLLTSYSRIIYLYFCIHTFHWSGNQRICFCKEGTRKDSIHKHLFLNLLRKCDISSTSLPIVAWRECHLWPCRLEVCRCRLIIKSGVRGTYLLIDVSHYVMFCCLSTYSLSIFSPVIRVTISKFVALNGILGMKMEGIEQHLFSL